MILGAALRLALVGAPLYQGQVVGTSAALPPAPQQSMEASMKILTSAMAIAIVLTLSSAGETAQKKKAKPRAITTAQQYDGQYQVRGSRTRSGTPCVSYTWEGCLGWDPDPFIRFMIDMDRGKDNH
jgi:hypothetical protein